MSALLLHPADASAVAVEEFVDELAHAFGRTLTVYQRECLTRSLARAVDAAAAAHVAAATRELVAT